MTVYSVTLCDDINRQDTLIGLFSNIGDAETTAIERCGEIAKYWSHPHLYQIEIAKHELDAVPFVGDVVVKYSFDETAKLIVAGSNN